jgi:hypothetical protein
MKLKTNKTFTKEPKKIKLKRIRTKVEISIMKRTTLKF